jgi:hypothetical protein
MSPGGAAKAVAIVALLGGIPLGVASHVVGRQLTQQKRKEQELQARIDYYRNATRGLESGLAAS